MSFPEELQRKCIHHLRSPPVASTSDEYDKEDEMDAIPEAEERAATNAVAVGSADGGADGDAEALKTGVDDVADKDDEADRDVRDAGETRAGGTGSGAAARRERERERTGHGHGQGTRGRNSDDRWEENLDWKLAPIVGEVDLVEYGGRSIEE